MLSLLAAGRVVAERDDPELWERSKGLACERHKLCLHSARKMQMAVKIYKESGGGYLGPKSPHNSLVKWGKQRWRTSDGSKARGEKRYLPSAVWDRLSDAEKEAANRTKAKGHARGIQYVPNPPAVKRAVAAARR